MGKHLHIDEELVRDAHDVDEADVPATGGLPSRLLTAFEVAEYIGCQGCPVIAAVSRCNFLSRREM